MRTLLLPFAALWAWARRRRPGPDEFPYHGRSMVWALLLIVLVSLPVELLLVAVLVPWLVVSVPLGALAVAVTVWFAGVVLGTRALPHAVARDGLVLRFGPLVEARVPWRVVETAVLDERRSPFGEGLSFDAASETALIQAGGRSDLTIELTRPISVRDGARRRGPVRRICVAVDDAAGLLARIRERAG